MVVASPTLRVSAALLICGLSGWPADGSEPPLEATEGYADAIRRASEELNIGRIAEAQQLLKTTDETNRGFEYYYLLARAAAASAPSPAPDLIEQVDTPEIETRYAKLNEVDAQIAFICRDGSIRVHELRDSKAPPKAILHDGGGAVWAGDFSSDGNFFVAGYENGEVVVWDAKTWKPRVVVAVGGESPIEDLVVAPDGSAFVARGDSSLELWSLADSKPRKIAEVGPRYNFGEGLAFSPQGDMIASGGMFDIVLYDAKTGQQLKSLRHASYTMGLVFSPDGKQIASAPRGNVNKLLAVFDIADERKLFEVMRFKYVMGLAFTPDGKRVIAAGLGEDVKLYDTQTGRSILSIDRSEATNFPCSTADGKLLGWAEPSGFHFIDLAKEPVVQDQGLPDE